VHPIERLRYVARAGPVPMGPLVQESAAALAAFADDPSALLTACRRLLDRRPGSAPLVWLAARMLTGPDPRSEAWDSVEQLERDPTVAELEFALPADARVLIVGALETTGEALCRRSDLTVLLADGFAVRDCDIVVIESECIGPSEALAASGSRAAAATALEAGIPVWLVGGVGRHLPARMWEGVLERVDRGEPWDREHELVPLRLVDRLVTPRGLRTPEEASRAVDCPIAPELFGTE
jgi:hypothetical protein